MVECDIFLVGSAKGRKNDQQRKERERERERERETRRPNIYV